MVNIDGIDSPEQLREQEAEAVPTQPTVRYDSGNPEQGDGGYGLEDQYPELPSEPSASDERESRPAKDKSLTNDGSQKKPSLSARIKDTLGKRRTKIWIAAGGGGGMVGLIILIVMVILVGLFKIPNLAANITQYEFVSLTRQFSKAADRVTAESVAVQAADEGTAATGATAEKPGGLFGDLKAKYYDPYVTAAKGKLGPVAEVWDGINSLRPSQIIDNLNTNHGFTFTVRTSGLTGRQVLKSISLDGVDYAIKPGGIQGWIPVWKDIVAANRYTTLEPEIMKALGAGGDNVTIGLLVRGGQAVALRSQWGIPLKAWVLSEFIGKDPVIARQIEAKQKAAEINETSNAPDNTATQELSDGVRAADEAEQEVLDSPPKLQNALDNQGMPKEVDAAISSAVQDSWTKQALDVVNPLYGIALPVCIIYDGSVQQSQPTIDNQTHHQAAAYYYVASAADQQKYGGGPALTAAIQATNKDLGDTGNTIPILRANGATVDTSAYTSSEAGASGAYYYDVFSALGISPASDAGNVLHTITGSVCGALTNTAVAVGLGAINIGVTIVSLGSSDAVTETVGEGAGAFVRKVVEDAVTTMFKTQVEKQGAKVIERTFLSRAGKFLFKQGIIVGATIGATELANYIVASRAHQVYGGLTQGNDLAMMADAGGNFVAAESSRVGFGRAMTNPEVGQRDSVNAQYLAYQNSTQDFTNRYFALSNPMSLASKLMIAADSLIQPRVGDTLTNVATSLLLPLNSVGSSLFSAFGIAHAAPNPNTQHYGNVQFGWSEDEEALIDSNPSYLPLQNQLILDQSGQADSIARDYHACFGYDYVDGDGSLNPSDPNGNLQLDINGDGSLGHLLADGNIVRNSDGSVVTDQGTCSPQNLGINNAKYGDLVFRWRLAMSYDITINHLTNLQTVSN